MRLPSTIKNKFFDLIKKKKHDHIQVLCQVRAVKSKGIDGIWIQQTSKRTKASLNQHVEQCIIPAREPAG